MTNSLSGPTAGHAQRVYQDIAVHPSGRLHPEQTTMLCEAAGCERVITPATSYSFVVVLATTGPGPALDAFQCGDEQHFTCSPACAKAAALVCMEHQLAELELRRRALTNGQSNDH